MILSLRVFEKQSLNKRGDCFALVSTERLDQRARNDMWAKVNVVREVAGSTVCERGGIAPKADAYAVRVG